MRHDDYTTAIERFLDDRGITDYAFERRRKHRAVVVMHRGRRVVVFFPASSCNWEGPRNAVTTLRRGLGLQGTA
jgi:hypothetical protein